MQCIAVVRSCTRQRRVKSEYCRVLHIVVTVSEYRYVKSFMNRVDLLLYHGLVPYIVFDGADLPAKAATESDREAYVASDSRYLTQLM